MITQSRIITFRLRGADWQYKLWLDDRGWYWKVGSMDGIEETEEAASSAARRYIKRHKLQAAPSAGTD